MKVVIEADGGSRGNPGPAGYGAVVWSADRATVLAESKQAIGQATNNVAEYRGLIAGLEEAAKLGATEVEVYMDSKLVVEQMSGRWKVKHPDLIALHAAGPDAGGAVRPDQLRVDSAGAQLARRPVGQRGDGRRGRPSMTRRKSSSEADRRSEPRKPLRPIADGARLDRRARHADPAAAAAPRPDRVVGGAPLFGPRQPGAHRAGRGGRPTRRRGIWRSAAASRR